MATQDPHRGFLSKKNTGWFAGTTKSFWVLDPAKVTFASYNAPGDEGLENGATRTVKCVHIVKVQKKPGAKFAVVLPSETMLFSCKTEQERDNWVDAFSYVLLNLVPDDAPTLPTREEKQAQAAHAMSKPGSMHHKACLLYTSDAADD